MLGNIVAGTFSAGAPPIPPSSYESIATVTVGSGGQSTITFSSIPSTYKHLQLRIAASTDRGTFALDNVFVTLNSDTNANYSHHFLQGDGSSASAGASANTTDVRSGSLPSSAAANVFGVSIFDILDYKNTDKYKTIKSLSGFDLNGTVSGIGGFLQFYSGNWRSTSAINSITLNRQSGTNFIQHSSFALYGIKD
jgi:hypothetical protein